MKGLIRIDCHVSRTHGWKAVIKRASGEVERLFSDGKHGGPEAAKVAAAAWLSSQWDKFPLIDRSARMAILRRNNRSGMAGVFRWPADGSDVPGAYWAAQWVIEPSQSPKRKKFLISTHGESEAKRLAIAKRKQALQMISKRQAAV